MNAILHLAAAAVFAVFWMVGSAHAAQEPQYRDLVIGPSLNADQPFFQSGTFMLGNEKISVEEGTLPKNKLVSYDEAAHKIVVSNDKSLSEADKGAAVLQLMDALSLQAVEPAAGR